MAGGLGGGPCSIVHSSLSPAPHPWRASVPPSAALPHADTAVTQFSAQLDRQGTGAVVKALMFEFLPSPSGILHGTSSIVLSARLPIFDATIEHTVSLNSVFLHCSATCSIPDDTSLVVTLHDSASHCTMAQTVGGLAHITLHGGMRNNPTPGPVAFDLYTSRDTQPLVDVIGYTVIGE